MNLLEIFRKNPFVSTDTRKLPPGCIFFALKGPSFNGNVFAEQALASGAAYAVVDEKEYVKNESYILVDDALSSLQELATAYRKTLKTTIIAIAGSNGKTTSKELISAVLSTTYKTFSTRNTL
jgi:UDP-N-acetylmuramoyl-tripeptide--D-alanyl-D-alanine ligase